MAQCSDGSIAPFSQSKRSILLALSFLHIMASANSALAEPAPGDACTTPGAYTHAGGPEVEDDRGFMLVCSGANNVWESVLEYSTESGRAKVNIDYDGTSCTTAKTGRLRYNPSTDEWEYCDGSDPWLPFEQAGSAGLAGPADCPEIGEACDDDTIFAGWNPVTHERLFIPPTDQGQLAWRSAGAGSDTGAVDIADGRINQQWIEANRTIAAYPAFKACADLNAANHLGHNDWYLPSRGEVYYLWLVRTQLESKAETIFQNANYWSSTENLATTAWYQHFTYGSQSLNDKTHGTIWVRCVRR